MILQPDATHDEHSVFVFASPFSFSSIAGAPGARYGKNMAALITRHDRILETLEVQGYLTIEEMAEMFAVSPQTIRRDIRDLAERGLLRRHHGGASINRSTANAAYNLRYEETAAEKAAIAEAAARLVKPGNSLFLTPGTTVDAFARALARCQPAGLRIVTNSISAATILADCPDVSIQVTGGRWSKFNGAVCGMYAAEFVEQYRCDLLVTSIGGIDSEGNLLEYRDEEVVVGRSMLRNARRRVLLADHTKFGRVAMARLAHLRDFNVLVTDRQPVGVIKAMIEEARCELLIAQMEPELERKRA